MPGRPKIRERQRLQALIDANATALPHPRRTEPTAYSPDLIPELLDLADQGLAPVEIAAHWAVSEEDLKAWEKAHSDFAVAIRHAYTRAKACWVRWIREAVAKGDSKFAAGAWSHYMRATYPEYDDKKGVTVNLDLGQLVVIQRREPPEPLQERMAAGDKPLIEGRTVRLQHSPTAEGSAGQGLGEGADGD